MPVTAQAFWLDHHVLRGGEEGPACPFPAHLGSYWRQRHQIFHRFDEGIELDAEALFQTKPEQTALDIAAVFERQVILDAFCGVGGVSIALARCGKTVIALDKYIHKLRMAENNARIYGVRDRITFKQTDSVDYLGNIPSPIEGVYFDPPWGGPGYTRRRSFGFDDFVYADHYRFKLREFISKNTHLEIALSVPMNFAFRELRSIRRPVEVIDHLEPGRNLAHTLHFPPAAI